MAASDRGSGGGQVLLSLGVVVSRLVQVGVLGTSYWVADFHLPALRSHAGARVRAICGRDRRRAQALAEQHDVPEVYTDYRAMIDSSELDALVVVMPEDLHHPMVMAGVEAGLHVLCEKPMAFTADRSGEMLAAERARVKHMVQFTNRGLPHYRWIKHLLEDGYIGMPYHAYFTWPTGWYPAQQPNSYFWWADARRAKGAVNELGAHMIARPRVAARRLAEHRRSRTATHRTDSGNERQQWNARSPLGRLDSAGLKDRRHPPRTVRRRGTRGS